MVAGAFWTQQWKRRQTLVPMISRVTLRIAPIVGLAVFSTALFAKGKHHKQDPQPQDQIEVVAHVALPGDSVVRFVPTQHYRRYYLYAERQSGKMVTLLDVTDLNHPAVLAEVSDPGGSTDAIVAAAGNAALVTTGGAATDGSGGSNSTQTFRIINFADPMHPSVQQEFKGVTAMMRDDQRGLIFLANADGIWILQQKLAMDPEFVKEWEHMVSAP